MARVLARSGDGEWRPLESVAQLGPRDFEGLLGDDLSLVLGTGRPLLVAAAAPDLPGRPDAVCVSDEGELTIVVSCFGEAAETALFRLLECAGSLQGMELEDFRAACERAARHASFDAFVDAHAPGRRKGSVDRAVKDALASGQFELMAVVPKSYARIAGPLRFLGGLGSTAVSCWELLAQAAGTVQTVQARQVEVASRAGALAPLSGLTGADLVEAVRRNGDDARRTVLYAQLVEFAEQAFAEVAYEQAGGDAVQLHGRLLRGAPETTVLYVDSRGTVAVDFRALGVQQRTQLAEQLARVLGWDVGDASALTRQELSVREHLDDESLMERFVEALRDAVAPASSEKMQTDAAGEAVAGVPAPARQVAGRRLPVVETVPVDDVEVAQLEQIGDDFFEPSHARPITTIAAPKARHR